MLETGSNTYRWDIENPNGYANAMGRYKTEKELEFVLAHIAGQHKDILDLGGGSGRFAIPLADRGHHVTVVDVSAEALRLLHRQKDPRISTLCADFLTHDFEQQFEVVLAIESVQFFTAIPFEMLFTKIHSTLRPRGRFVFTELNRRSWRYGLHTLSDSERFPYNVAGPDDYKTALRNAGFELLSMEGFVWMPFTVASNSHFVPLFQSIERAFHLNRWIRQSPWLLIAAERS